MQVDLAEEAEVSKQTMSKIMNGAKAINAIELHKISEYLQCVDRFSDEDAKKSRWT